MAGCTLEECLKQFIVAEQVENYSCSHCWHIAAMKFLSLKGAKEVTSYSYNLGYSQLLRVTLLASEEQPWVILKRLLLFASPFS